VQFLVCCTVSLLAYHKVGLIAKIINIHSFKSVARVILLNFIKIKKLKKLSLPKFSSNAAVVLTVIRCPYPS